MLIFVSWEDWVGDIHGNPIVILSDRENDLGFREGKTKKEVASFFSFSNWFLLTWVDISLSNAFVWLFSVFLSLHVL